MTLPARIRAAISLLVGLTGRQPRETRLSEEIAFHIDMQTEKNIARGMPPDDARRAATLSFGGREAWREAARDEYRSRPLDDLGQDLRYAVRTLASAPAFTLAAVLTLAIGIGGNTAIFSVVDGVLLKSLPFTQPERVVSLFQFHKTKSERDDVASGTFFEWRARSNAFSAMAAAEPFGFVMTGTEGEEQIGNWNVTRDFFDVLDAKPVIGRLFTDQDFESARPEVVGPVVVLTYASWQTRFGGDPTIVGRKLILSKQPVTVIGVLPRGFSYLDNPHYEAFSPKVLDEYERKDHNAAYFHVVARIKPGVTLAAATAELDRVETQLGREFPKTNGDVGVEVVRVHDGIVGNAARALLLLLGAVGFVLLIACTNVANLMLARTTRRSREFAIRAALGAGRARIARQVLAESFVIALAGGAAGVAFAYWATGAIRRVSPASLPRVTEMHVDARAMAFAFAAVVITTFLFGLVPAVRAAEPASQDELKAGGRAVGHGAQHRLRGMLVTAEVALAVMLLVGAGLLVRSFVSVVQQDRGYKPDHVISATVFVWQWNRTPAARRQFVARLVDRAAQLPGVTAAGATSSLPLGRAIGAEASSFTIVGQSVEAGQEPHEHATALTPGAFTALDMRVRRGRLFTNHDDSASAQVIVVNEAMVRRYWPHENPIGRHVRLGFYDKPIEREVVGVVADVRQAALDLPPEPIVYLPHAQAPTGAMSLVLRTAMDPSSLSRDIKRMVAELNPELPVASIQTLDSIVDDSLKPRRFTLLLFAAFSAAALVLAVVGVYGVISQGTTERVREFGLRIALGAQGGDIIRMVMVQGLAAAGLGVVLGVIGSALLTRLLANMLFAVSPIDVVTYGAVSGVMLVTALAACYLPARRATRVDPVVALRAG